MAGKESAVIDPAVLRTRRMLYRGDVWKQREQLKTWTDRRLALYDDRLVYFTRDSTERPKGGVFLESVQRVGAGEVDLREGRYIFEVITPGVCYNLAVPTASSRDQWISAITKAIAAVQSKYLGHMVDLTEQFSAIRTQSHSLRDAAVQKLQVNWRLLNASRTDRLPSIEWQPDEAVTRCPICDWQFSKIGITGRRRHHCRLCGRVVCSSCSSDTPTVLDAQVRDRFAIKVCTHCRAMLVASGARDQFSDSVEDASLNHPALKLNQAMTQAREELKGALSYAERLIAMDVQSIMDWAGRETELKVALTELARLEKAISVTMPGYVKNIPQPNAVTAQVTQHQVRRLKNLNVEYIPILRLRQRQLEQGLEQCAAAAAGLPIPSPSPVAVSPTPDAMSPGSSVDTPSAAAGAAAGGASGGAAGSAVSGAVTRTRAASKPKPAPDAAFDNRVQLWLRLLTNSYISLRRLALEHTLQGTERSDYDFSVFADGFHDAVDNVQAELDMAIEAANEDREGYMKLVDEMLRRWDMTECFLVVNEADESNSVERQILTGSVVVLNKIVGELESRSSAGEMEPSKRAIRRLRDALKAAIMK